MLPSNLEFLTSMGYAKTQVVGSCYCPETDYTKVKFCHTWKINKGLVYLAHFCYILAFKIKFPTKKVDRNGRDQILQRYHLLTITYRK